IGSAHKWVSASLRWPPPAGRCRAGALAFDRSPGRSASTLGLRTDGVGSERRGLHWQKPVELQATSRKSHYVSSVARWSLPAATPSRCARFQPYRVHETSSYRWPLPLPQSQPQTAETCSHSSAAPSADTLRCRPYANPRSSRKGNHVIAATIAFTRPRARQPQHCACRQAVQIAVINRGIGRHHHHDRPIRRLWTRHPVRGALVLLQVIYQVVVAQFLGNRNTSNTQDSPEVCLDQNSYSVAAERVRKPP